ncbi:MAG: TIGR03943 family protein [Anaerolineae bacterium]|nr:TIGR03943 family protein [Anaerolineae bacterium]
MNEHSHQHDHHDHTHDAHRLQAWIKTAILLGLGAYFAYNILSGNLANYINNRFAWLSVVAAGLFLLLGLMSALDLLRHSSHSHDQHEHHDHAHEHGLSWPILGVVAIPLLLGVLVPSRPLGASAIDGNYNANAAVEGSDFASFGSDPLTWNVLNWLRAINYSEDLGEFSGQQADVIGFIYRNDQFPADHFMVMRFVISCCVADATPVGLPFYWQAPVSLPNDTWVRVVGTFELGEFGGNVAPILQAESVEFIDEPEHPYLYP